MIVMNKFLKFHKKDRPSFEIKEDCLGQIEMPDMANESVDFVDDIQTGYDDPRWIERSNSIKARDNYTCQLCHAFNPMQDGLIFVQQGKYETYHHYYWAGNSKYDIHLKDYSLTINFDFGPNYHLTVPRLNVHHKIYYKNRNLWDYEDDCLVTLCEDCHHYVHSLTNIGVPIVEEQPNGHNILIGKTQAKPYQHILDHTDLDSFQPLTIVKLNRWGIGLKGRDMIDFERAQKENKRWFEYQDKIDNHVVHISYFINKYTPEEAKKAAEYIILDFIENILGYSKENR